MSHKYPYRPPPSDTDLRPDPGPYRSSESHRHASLDHSSLSSAQEPFCAAASSSSSRGGAVWSQDSALHILSSCGLEPGDLALLAELPEDVLTVETLPHVLKQIKGKRGTLKPPSSHTPSSTHRPTARGWDQRHTQPIQYPLGQAKPAPVPPELQEHWVNPRPNSAVSTDAPSSSSLSSSSSFMVDSHHRPGPSEFGKTSTAGPGSCHERAGVQRSSALPHVPASPSAAFTSAPPPEEHRPHPRRTHPKSDASSNRSKWHPPTSGLASSATATAATCTLSRKEALDFHGATPQVFPYSCSLCDITVLSEKIWISHVNSSSHAEGQLSLLQRFPNWDCRMETVSSADSQSEKRTVEKRPGRPPQTANEIQKTQPKKQAQKMSDKSKVVCVRFPAQAVDETYLRKLTEPFGKIVKILMFPSLAFMELGSNDQAKDLVKFHVNYPLTVNGEKMEFHLSNTFNFLQSSKVISFTPAPTGDDGQSDLLSVVKRFGPPLYTLFLPSKAFVEMKNAADAQKLVDYYLSNSLKINDDLLKVSFSGEYNSLMCVTSARKYEEKTAASKRTRSRSPESEETYKKKRRPRRSRSRGRRSKSRSPSKGRRSRSRSPSKGRRSRSRSRSPSKGKRSRSPSKGKRSRSRSRTPSKGKRSRSRSRTPSKGKRSRSRSRTPSKGKRSRSRSRTPSKGKRSRSRSRTPSKGKRSRSRSRTPSKGKRSRSRSRSPSKGRRSRSRSPSKGRRSRSRSPSKGRRSRSRSPSKGRRSRSQPRGRRSRSRSRSRSRGGSRPRERKSNSRDKSTSRDETDETRPINTSSRNGRSRSRSCGSRTKETKEEPDKPESQSTTNAGSGPVPESRPEPAEKQQSEEEEESSEDESDIEGMEVIGEDGHNLEDDDDEEEEEDDDGQTEDAAEDTETGEKKKEDVDTEKDNGQKAEDTKEDVKEESSRELEDEEEDTDFFLDLDNCITLDELEEEEITAEPQSPSTRVVFFKNLPQRFYTDEDFVRLVDSLGTATRYLLLRRQGQGFMEMSSSSDALKAVRELNCTLFFGSRLDVNISNKYNRLVNGFDVQLDSKQDDRSGPQSPGNTISQFRTSRGQGGIRESSKKMLDKDLGSCKSPEEETRSRKTFSEKKNSPEQIPVDEKTSEIDSVKSEESTKQEDRQKDSTESPEEDQDSVKKPDQPQTQQKPAVDVNRLQSSVAQLEEETVPVGGAAEPEEPTKPVGTKFVRPVVGYFCSLCDVIYADEDEAKVQHCSSLMHYKKYQEKTGLDPWTS